MKIRLLLGAAALGLAMPAIAQEMTPPADPSGANVPPAPTAPPPPDGMTDMPAPPAPPSPPADPNATVPKGEVPPTPGMVPADPNAPMDPAAPVGTAANPVVVGGNATLPPAPQADYPVCSKTVQDSCINPGEGPAKKKARRRR